MGKIANYVKEFLNSNDIKFLYIEQDLEARFEFGFLAGNSQVKVLIDIDEQREFVVAKGMPVETIKSLEKIWPIMNQCNAKNMFVKIQVDPQNGELKFSMSCLAMGGAINQTMVATLIVTFINTMKDCIPQLLES